LWMPSVSGSSSRSLSGPHLVAAGWGPTIIAAHLPQIQEGAGHKEKWPGLKVVLVPSNPARSKGIQAYAKTPPVSHLKGETTVRL
jgi:pyruvate/2-oxoglutarate/acetoin dehydrogenase E1 component